MGAGEQLFTGDTETRVIQNLHRDLPIPSEQQAVLGSGSPLPEKRVEAGLSGVQGQPWPHNKFGANLGYNKTLSPNKTC